ncbi:MAG: 2,5-diamino-6-(ribosylamino)-4(3H)-pyrimidinone 5'-phosphate reductase [Candidatus Hodarchaeota archaeon]
MKRPIVTLNAAMSLDGRIATAIERDATLSSREDWIRVHKLRAKSDAIMVGAGTIRIDNPTLRVKRELLPSESEINNPIRVIPSSLGDIDPKARVITVQPEIPTIIAVTSKAPKENVDKLKKIGVEVFICGSERFVNLVSLLKQLYERGIRTLMLEGGATLNWAMLKAHLIDNISIAIAPVISGGKESISLFEGYGHRRMADSPLLELQSTNMAGDCLILKYKVNYEHKRGVNS